MKNKLVTIDCLFFEGRMYKEILALVIDDIDSFRCSILATEISNKEIIISKNKIV